MHTKNDLSLLGILLSVFCAVVFSASAVRGDSLAGFEEKDAKADKKAKSETAEKPDAKEEEESKKEEEKDEFLAVVGGDVHTVSDGVRRGATVLTKNKKIFAIGYDVPQPEGTTVIDAKGMRVYPGIVAVRSSGVVGSGKIPENSFDPYGFNVILALAHGITTVTTGNTAVKLTYGTLDGHVLKRDLFVTLQYDRRSTDRRIKVRKDLAKVRDYLRELNEYALKKSSGDTEAKEPNKSWLKGAYLNYYRLLRGEAQAMVRASSALEIRDVCDLAQDFGFKLVIERASEGWTLPTELSRSSARLILTARRGRQPGSNPVSNRSTGWNVQNPAILHEHGVPFALIPASSSIATLFGIPGRDLLALSMEAAFAVSGGLPQDAALSAITLDAARVLGVDAQVGSLEVGKDADLIVTDGDLLHYTTWVQYAVVNGRLVYDKEKEPVVSHIRSRKPATAEEMLQFWPRRATDPTGRAMPENQ